MSDSHNPTIRSQHFWQSLRLCLWTIAALAMLDITVGQVFSREKVEHQQPLSGLTRYFEFGRSAQGTINTVIGATDAETDPEYVDFLSGCITDDPRHDLSWQSNSPDEPLIAIYGMSFSAHVARAISVVDPAVRVRSLASACAPPSHVYAKYNADREHHEADAVVLSLLASSVPYTLSMTGMTWGVEQPFPYTYPRYFLNDGEIRRIDPVIASPSDFRNAIDHHEMWEPFVMQLREWDPYYSPLTFRESLLDSSVTVRLCRRAYAQQRIRELKRQVHTPEGFDPECEMARVLSALVRSFAASAREDNRKPIVLLLHDQGYDDHLFQLLAPVLDADEIPYVSTHEICPADDPTSFVPDGHFTPEASELIAKQVVKHLISPGITSLDE